MDETCRLRRGEGYAVCADEVVSKCALKGIYLSRRVKLTQPLFQF